MDEIKIIFFDIDGTLVDHSTGKISGRTFFALEQLRKQGMLLCVATGRPTATLPDFGGFTFDGYVTFNGSYCFAGQQTVFGAPISPDSVERILQNCTALGRPVSLALCDRIITNGVDRDLADYFALAGRELTVAEDFEQGRKENIYQIMVGCREQERPAIMQGVSDVKMAISWDRAVDVVSAGGGKGTGVKKMLEHFGLDASQALAFGDSYNDLEMVEAVGTGVAMGNGAPLLKAAADEVCGPVSQDGIYHYCVARGWIRE